MLIIESQLHGCAKAILDRQESITIEVAEPISQEQGTEIKIDWTELASTV